MYIQVDLSTPGSVELREQQDFRGFKVVVDGGSAGDGSLAESLQPYGWLDGGDAMLRIEAVRGLAGASGDDPAWLEQFDAMVAFARSHGWLDAGETAIRAHIEGASR